ncbi:MAG: site-specific DNA-methyltransferase [Spirochaetota bacterium]|nr:site-specific DNA-methyltransferase [Spirochaetota bacterium]
MTDFNTVKIDLIAKLGIPYHETDSCILFCGDTLQLQKKSGSRYFDAIITSPPYNIGKEYEAVRPLQEYIEWTAEWIDGARKLLKNSGALLLNLGYIPIDDKGRAVPLPYILWDKIPMYLNQEIVWNYSAGVACKNYLSPRNEKILWYVNDKENYVFNLDAIRDKNVKYPNSKRNGKPRVHTLGKNPSDVWEIAKVTTGLNRSSEERTSHPCQFPADLINRLVLGFTNENAIVFDPFMGSGTTFESCLRHNRFCVGFEIVPEYCEIAKQRIISVEAEIKHTATQLELERAVYEPVCG